MTLTYCGTVDSEEGYLLLGDALALQIWRGSDEEQNLSNLIDAMDQEGLPGGNIPIAHETGVLWDIEGSGTVDIFCDEADGNLLLVRCWLDDTDEEEAVRMLSSLPAALGDAFAEFEVKSGYLAILSSVEYGTSIRKTEQGSFELITEAMMTESSGRLLHTANGYYRCFHDAVKAGQNEARRCHILFVTN